MIPDRAPFARRFPALVASLSSAQIDALIASFTARTLTTGEVLFVEGDRVEDLYLTWEGELDVLTHGERLGKLGPGALLGEVAWIDRGTATAGVVAGTDATVLRLDRVAYERLRRDEPHVAAALLRGVSRAIAGRLRLSEARFDAHRTGAPLPTGAPEARRGLLSALLALFTGTEA